MIETRMSRMMNLLSDKEEECVDEGGDSFLQSLAEFSPQE